MEGHRDGRVWRGERLSILLLCYEYPPLGGGGGVGAKTYAEAWVAQGHRVMVITGGDGQLRSREMVGGVDVVRVRLLGRKDRATSTGLSMLSYLVAGAWFIARSRRMCKTFDVINTHFSLPTGPLGWFAAAFLSLPHILTIIGGDIYDPTKGSSPHRHRHWRILNRFLMDQADRVVAISSDTEQRAREHYAIDRSIAVINYGFRPRDPIEDGLPRRGGDGLFELIAVGRLVERKGFGYLIEAVGRLPPDIKLCLIGDGPLSGELRSLAEREHVDDRISFLGYLDRQEIDRRLRAADCFVLSSLHEGLGIVVQEAMFAGLPVVATDNGGQVDLIRDGRNGLLVPPADSGALAEAITRVYNDPEFREKCRENNLTDIRAYFVDTNAAEYIDVFRSSLASSA